MKQKQLFVMISLLLASFAGAQPYNAATSDSLRGKTYSYLSLKASPENVDTEKALLYAKAWLAKSKMEADWKQTTLAYKTIMYYVDKNQLPFYAGCMLAAAKHTHDNILIGSAYMKKGIILYDRKEHTKALDNYILADRYISLTDDLYSTYKVKYLIAHTKYYLGFYDEAIALFNECIAYFKEENDRAYLNSLHSLGLCYNRIGKYDRCTEINKQGIAAGLEFGNLEMAPYFLHSEGINQCSVKNYAGAIKKLTESLPDIIKNKDFANETVAHFYIGRSYWFLGKKEMAVSYFKKVDKICEKENYMRPDLREAYELLIGYYAQLDDKKMQLFYINRLLKVDRIIEQEYKYLAGKIFREYDTKKLLQTRQEIEQSMKFRTIIGITVIVLMGVIILMLIYRHHRNKKRFEKLMAPKPVAVKSLMSNSNDTDISPEVVTVILKNLEKFERNKKYLEKDMSLVKIASLLNTNTKYVTKIITRYRGKGTIEYISELKIDHIVELLKQENKYRNYTNKALGEEAGFGSTQNFTRAFNARTGISPTYFIQQLKKTTAPVDLH